MSQNQPRRAANLFQGGNFSSVMRQVAVATPVATTAAGPLYLETATLVWMGTDDALARLCALHDVAVGSKAGRWSSALAGEQYSADEAFTAFSNLTTSVTAQLAASPTDGITMALDSICSVVNETGSLDGLEGPFLTAVLSLLGSGQNSVLDRAGQTLQNVGLASIRDGGAERTMIYNQHTHQLTFANEAMLSGVIGPGAGLSSLSNLPSLFSMSGSLSGMLDTTSYLAGDIGTTANYIEVFATMGAIAGAVIGGAATLETGPGALAGAWGGAKVGAEAGALVGGAVGLVVGAMKEEAPPHPSSDGSTIIGGHTGPAPTGGMSGPHGTSEPAPPATSSSTTGVHKCPEPDLETGFDGSGTGDWLGWTPTSMARGSGLNSLVTYGGGSALSFVTLPAFDESGEGLNLGYLASIPQVATRSTKGYITIPSGQDTDAPNTSIDLRAMHQTKLGYITIPSFDFPVEG